MVERLAVSFAPGSSRQPWCSICRQLAIRSGRRTLRLRFLLARRCYHHHIRSVTTPSAHAVVVLLARDESRSDQSESDPSCFFAAHWGGFFEGDVGRGWLRSLSVLHRFGMLRDEVFIFLLSGLSFLKQCLNCNSLKNSNRFATDAQNMLFLWISETF